MISPSRGASSLSKLSREDTTATPAISTAPGLMSICSAGSSLKKQAGRDSARKKTTLVQPPGPCQVSRFMRGSHSVSVWISPSDTRR